MPFTYAWVWSHSLEHGKHTSKYILKHQPPTTHQYGMGGIYLLHLCCCFEWLHLVQLLCICECDSHTMSTGEHVTAFHSLLQLFCSFPTFQSSCFLSFDWGSRLMKMFLLGLSPQFLILSTLRSYVHLLPLLSTSKASISDQGWWQPRFLGINRKNEKAIW